MSAKKIFDHLVNALSAVTGDAPPSRPQAIRDLPKLKQFGSVPAPSCCIVKRVGTGKLPEVRKPKSDK